MTYLDFVFQSPSQFL